MIKWTEKDVLEHARELRSPFEKVASPHSTNPEAVLKAIRDRGNGNRTLPALKR